MNRELLTNKLYVKLENFEKRLLLPNLSLLLRNVKLWSEFYCRWWNCPFSTSKPSVTTELYLQNKLATLSTSEEKLADLCIPFLKSSDVNYEYLISEQNEIVYEDKINRLKNILIEKGLTMEEINQALS